MSNFLWLSKLGKVIGGAIQSASDGCNVIIQKHPRWLLVILTLLWLIPGLDTLPLVDRDEPRFAYATQEMLQNQAEGKPHAWAVPYFNEQYRFDKPPVVYWWMGIHYFLGGYSDFTARLHSVEATLLCVLLIFGFATRLYDRKVGFWAAFAFLTCFQVLQHGRLCVADMPMMVFVIAALWSGWELWQKRSWGWAFVFWTSLGLGFSTKWIVPWAAVGLTLVLFTLIMRRWPPLANYKPFSGIALMVAIIVAWAVPAYIATDGDFFKVGLGVHVLERGAEAMNSRHYNPFFYLLTALVSLMPWIAGVGGIFPALRKTFGDREKFLVAGIVGIYVLFSAAQTQLPHYVLPAFPLLLILLAGTTSLNKPSGKWSARFFYGFYALFGLLFAALLIMVAAVPVSEQNLGLKQAGLSLIFCVIFLLGMGLAKAYRQSSLVLLAFLISALSFGNTAALLRPKAVTVEVAQRLGHIGADVELIANGFEEPGLTAYTKQTWNYSPRFEEAIEAYAAADKAVLVVLVKEFSLENVFRRLFNKPLKVRNDRDGKLLELSDELEGSRLRLEGLNLGRFSWIVYELYQKQ